MGRRQVLGLGMDGRRGDIEFIIVMLNGIDCKSREEEKPVLCRGRVIGRVERRRRVRRRRRWISSNVEEYAAGRKVVLL